MCASRHTHRSSSLTVCYGVWITHLPDIQTFVDFILQILVNVLARVFLEGSRAYFQLPRRCAISKNCSRASIRSMYFHVNLLPLDALVSNTHGNVLWPTRCFFHSNCRSTDVHESAGNAESHRQDSWHQGLHCGFVRVLWHSAPSAETSCMKLCIHPGAHF